MTAEVANHIAFRQESIRSLSSEVGVYVLCDIDETPVYVGKSTDGIRQRVRRHLTSARSDVIANRQIDVWEIAYVWEYLITGDSNIDQLEAVLFHHYNQSSRLMNGTIPQKPPEGLAVPRPTNVVQVMSDKEIFEKRQPEQRLSRQARHYANIVDHFLSVKNSKEIARALDAHFDRLKKYHTLMLSLISEEK